MTTESNPTYTYPERDSEQWKAIWQRLFDKIAASQSEAVKLDENRDNWMLMRVHKNGLAYFKHAYSRNYITA